MKEIINYIPNIILEAVQQNPRIQADNDEIIKVIKQWLVRAKDRLINNTKKTRWVNFMILTVYTYQGIDISKNYELVIWCKIL